MDKIFRRQVQQFWYWSRPFEQMNYRLVSNYQLNAQFLYSITIYMLHYNPRHVSSSTMLIFRSTNCIIAASGIVTLCKQPYSMPVESGLQSALHLHTVRPLQRVTIPEAVIIQFVLLKMSKVLLDIYCYRIKKLCIKLVIWKKCTVRKNIKLKYSLKITLKVA